MRADRFVASALVVTALSATAHAQDRARGPQGPAGTVTLPVGDYDRLVDRATQPATRPADPPPVPAVIARSEIRARVDGSSVRGTLRVDGDVFQRGPVKVPLVQGATLLEARMEPPAAPAKTSRTLPVLHENGVHSAILGGPGAFAATLDWAATVTSSPGRATFVLPQPVSGSVSAVVDLPGDPADVRVEGGLITRRQAAAGRTTLEVTATAAARPRVSWSVRESAVQAAPAETRMLADVKSLLTIGDGELRMVSLVEISVLRGAPRTFEVQLPAAYDVASVTGRSLESNETRGRTLVLTVREPASRHQFLVSLEQPRSSGSFKLDTSFPIITGVQREAGEAAIEGTGTIEVNAGGDEALRRMDVRETNASLRTLARQPLLAAFRYQRRPNEIRTMTVDVRRFADAPVLAAAAERASVTTLVTPEGRTLTEVVLKVRNRAQPFMKVALPAGASVLSVDVAGETAKPVLGADGTRIPLLRTGLRPDGPYEVSFVYLHAGQALGKRGAAQMMLPRLEVPIGVLDWEVFLPEQYAAKPIAGKVLPAVLVERTTVEEAEHTAAGSGRNMGSGVGGGTGGGAYRGGSAASGFRAVAPGQIVGRIVDPLGAPIPGATLTVTGPERVRVTAVSDAAGYYTIQDVPSGRVVVTSELPGFVTGRRTFVFDQRPRRVDFTLEVGALTETVTVSAEPPVVDEAFADRRDQPVAQQAPSQNVLNLQRRVAGVLPVRVDVPRAGTLHRFTKPLVFDEETTVSFSYKSR